MSLIDMDCREKPSVRTGPPSVTPPDSATKPTAAVGDAPTGPLGQTEGAAEGDPIRVVVIEPAESQAATGLHEQIVIGKAEDCDLGNGDDCYMSRRHARMYRDNGQVLIEDLGSANGTLLRVHRPIALQPGDEIVAGTTVIGLEGTAT
jgi:pSer/pThr/pTyr-binding forkhead associated (FHA) protein